MEGQNIKALLVDDDRHILKTTASLLRACGVNDLVLTADGSEALSALQDPANKFDLIFLDLNMPRMDGLEFLRHLSTANLNSGVVLVSGEDRRLLTTAKELGNSHKLNMVGVIAKPITLHAIREIVRTFGSRMPPSPAKVDMTGITEEELKYGLSEDQLVAYFQPKVNIATGKLVGTEALVRWQHPERGLLGPGLFVPLAEQCGLIDELTVAVLEKSLAQCKAWNDSGLVMKISVNVSIETLQDLNFPNFLMQTAEKFSIQYPQLIIEVTESRFMSVPANPLEVLSRLYMKGFQLSIDDFGTGFSSLEQLKKVPFTEMKIDRTFVHGAGADQETMAILESSVDLGKKLGLSLVAEGVENQEDWDIVSAVGCHIVQGYFVAKPMPGGEIAKWSEDSAVT